MTIAAIAIIWYLVGGFIVSLLACRALHRVSDKVNREDQLTADEDRVAVQADHIQKRTGGRIVVLTILGVTLFWLPIILWAAISKD